MQGYDNRTGGLAPIKSSEHQGYGNATMDVEISTGHLTQCLILATWESVKLNPWCCKMENLQTSFE